MERLACDAAEYPAMLRSRLGANAPDALILLGDKGLLRSRRTALFCPARNEPLGQAIVPNDIPFSKIHHAAFDAHLIGIDPDFRVHVAGRLLKQHDGPMLEVLKRLHRNLLHLPARKRDWPDRERLALRFDEFRGYE